MEKKNFQVVNMGDFKDLLEKEFNGGKGKYFIGQDIGLTGCEVSINCLPAGQSVPFVHAHKKNEELYIIIDGNGIFFIDGEEFPVQEGSLIRVSPNGQRALKAGEQDLYFICIQAQANSLEQATMKDGIIVETKASWM
ncbi:cupin domain-containing protein [Anaerosinus sp.]|uniref:cupin domain-containing protein n=1 Tax=Selenobaculum sp. TaxID=3074374 RepID=UPI0015B210C8